VNKVSAVLVCFKDRIASSEVSGIIVWISSEKFLSEFANCPILLPRFSSCQVVFR